MDRIFEPTLVLALLAVAALAAVSGLVVGARRGDGSAARRAAEAAALAVIGGFLARALVSVLLSAGEDSRGTTLLIGWTFLFVNGVVDTLLAPFGITALTRPGALLASAFAVGAFTGAMNGVFRVYDWQRLGVPQFVGDVTWGLSGSTTGALLHLFNSLFGQRSTDERTGANRFRTGFHVPGHDDFAFTQGSVMSNLDEPPGGALWRHERTHVFQSRMFGPVFTLTYLGWMALLVVPALVARAIARDGGGRVEGWCYYSNPWEVWAYIVQRQENDEAAGNDVRVLISNRRCWSEPLVAIVAVPYFLVATAVLLVLVAAAG